MNNSKLEEQLSKSFWMNLLSTFDTGKAIVAAIVVGVLGYLTNLLTSLYSFVYWNGYFECFNLPLQYFESAVDTVSGFYGFAVAVPLSAVYLILQLKYNRLIKRALENNPKRKMKRRSLAYWILRSSTYFAMPAAYLALVFLVLISLDGGNDFILSIVISSSTMNVLISILLGGEKSIPIQPDAQHQEPSRKKDIHGLFAPALIIGVTVFLLSLIFVYLLGYFQKVILVDVPQVIAVDSEDTTQEYGMLLETDTSYICAPIAYVEGKEYIMHIQNSSYRVIPKDEIVTITESDAWVLYRDKGAGLLFDFIAYDEGAFWNLLFGTVGVSAALLYLEYLLLIKKRNRKVEN